METFWGIGYPQRKKWLLQNEMIVRGFGYLLKTDPTRLKGAKQRSK